MSYDIEIDDLESADWEGLIADREGPDHLTEFDPEDVYEPDISLDDTAEDEHWLADLEAEYADMIDEWEN